MNKKVAYLDLKDEILQKIKEKGGWVNAHAHLDRAYTITEENFRYTKATLQEKWELNNEIKQSSTVEAIYSRMAQGIESMLEQGVSAVGTFIDVDAYIKDKAIKAAQKIREKYKNDLQI